MKNRRTALKHCFFRLYDDCPDDHLILEYLYNYPKRVGGGVQSVIKQIIIDHMKETGFVPATIIPNPYHPANTMVTFKNSNRVRPSLPVMPPVVEFAIKPTVPVDNHEPLSVTVTSAKETGPLAETTKIKTDKDYCKSILSSIGYSEGLPGGFQLI